MKIEKKNFKDIISTYTISIPDIQRDYVHGRQDERTKNILEKFLIDIDNLSNDSKLDFNFIYGVLENGEFIPVDGQQRLTLLFLLYWYDYFKCPLTEKEPSLNKFTYNLRDSARDFFKQLNNKDNIKDLKRKYLVFPYQNYIPYQQSLFDKERKYPIENLKWFLLPKLTTICKDSNWFLFEWLQDPTIKSILNVLDAIDEYFKNRSDLSAKLDRIFFLFEEVKADHEDLYIKLNSRGKPLNNFENFKAKLIGKIQENENQEDYKNFINKLEKWANIFENLGEPKDNYTNDELEQLIKNTDNCYLHFLVGAIACQHFTTMADSKENNFNQYIEEMIIGLQKIEKENLKILKEVEQTLDYLSETEHKQEPLKGKNKKSYLEAKINLKTNKKNKINFKYNNLLYLAVLLKAPKLSGNTDSKNIQYFIDFFTKMIENSPAADDNFHNFKEALKSIFKMGDILQSEQNKNIYDYLKGTKAKLTGFDADQYQEEILKAKCDGSLLDKIRNTEKEISYLKGNLASLLIFSSKTETKKLPPNPQDIDEKNFDLYSKMLKIILEIANQNDDKDFLVHRALLTQGNYLIRSGKNHTGVLAYFLEKNHRDYSWKNFLSQTHSTSGTIMKNLLDKINELGQFKGNTTLITKENIEKYLKEIISGYTEKDWRKYFIEDPYFIEKSIYISRNIKCVKILDKDILLQGSRTSEKVFNYYVLALTRKLGLNEIQGENPQLNYKDYIITLGPRRYIEKEYFLIEKDNQQIPLNQITDIALKNAITKINSIIYK